MQPEDTTGRQREHQGRAEQQFVAVRTIVRCGIDSNVIAVRTDPERRSVVEKYALPKRIMPALKSMQCLAKPTTADKIGRRRACCSPENLSR